MHTAWVANLRKNTGWYWTYSFGMTWSTAHLWYALGFPFGRSRRRIIVIDFCHASFG